MPLAKTLQDRLQAIWFGLFPPSCLVCGLAGQQAMDLCAGCLGDCTPLGTACQRCAEPLATAQSLCGRCNARLPAFDAVHAPFLYAPPLLQLITRYKYQRQLSAGHVLGKLLGQFVADGLQAGELSLPDSLVPVPLYPWRQALRGFNQAASLATDISRHIQSNCKATLPVQHWLQRTQKTLPQMGLSLAQRRRNLRGAFKVQGTPPRHIALIDDVLTSGTTANECARVLKQAGCETVQVWVLARAARPQ